MHLVLLVLSFKNNSPQWLMQICKNPCSWCQRPLYNVNKVIAIFWDTWLFKATYIQRKQQLRYPRNTSGYQHRDKGIRSWTAQHILDFTYNSSGTWNIILYFSSTHCIVRLSDRLYPEKMRTDCACFACPDDNGKRWALQWQRRT